MFTFKTSLALTVFVLTMVLPCFLTLTFTLVVLGVSALFSALAPALVSLMLFAEMLLPKPRRADERPASVAICIFCPPTVTTTVLAWVLISKAFRATDFFPHVIFRPPLWVTVPAPVVGSIVPPVTGSVALVPLIVAGFTAVILMPAFLACLLKPLLTVSVGLPFAIGIGAAGAGGARTSMRAPAAG